MSPVPRIWKVTIWDRADHSTRKCHGKMKTSNRAQLEVKPSGGAGVWRERFFCQRRGKEGSRWEEHSDVDTVCIPKYIGFAPSYRRNRTTTQVFENSVSFLNDDVVPKKILLPLVEGDIARCTTARVMVKQKVGLTAIRTRGLSQLCSGSLPKRESYH
jgi:hypothetical protein